MAKRTTNREPAKPASEAPKDLAGHIFYGLKLTDEQTEFRDFIYNPSYDIVLCEAKAGTGKTLVAVATAIVMFQYGLIDEIVYMVPGGVYESKQGYLPGTLDEKNAYMCVPLRQALVTLGYDPDHVIKNDVSLKEGAFITAQSDSYLRGCNIGDSSHRAVLIIDEAQNYSTTAMRTVLTRLGVGSKAVVIGDLTQCDLDEAAKTGFDKAMRLFAEPEWAAKCKLTKCFRSRVADAAEKL